jgi:hypothetical protein
MLTQRQQGLFSMLGIDPAREKEIRKFHKEDIPHGAVKDFTRWLTKRLHKKWQEQHRRLAGPYLGD